jgi:eukaryotic-like serine/threonine-protein kinase
VLEYIDGPTLGAFILSNRPDFDSAVAFAAKLMGIIIAIHDEDWIHRDIKPDNIILRDGQLDDPVLVDFGLSFNPDHAGGYSTERGQEIGNRFLRLPELAAGSSAKHDARSDLTIVGAAFFFALTGERPFALLDEDGRMPHQRTRVVVILKEAAGRSLLPVLHFFDRTFSQRLSGRFGSAREMAQRLGQIAAPARNANTMTNDEELALIVDSLNSDANRRLARLRSIYDRGMNVIREVHSEILSRVRPTYVSYQSGYVAFNEGFRNMLGFTHFSTHEHRFSPDFVIAELGDEIVIKVNDEAIYRTEANDPSGDATAY